jgi:xanthine dehydrogenase large subunit
MGQGVNAKLLQVAAQSFGVPVSRVRITSTNTTRVANTSPSAASATADLNGRALQQACDQILSRLRVLASDMTGKDISEIRFVQERVYIGDSPSDILWNTLIQKAIAQRISLSAKGHYATPVIYFDKQKEKGHPFAYHVYGTAIIEAHVDCIRGTYEIPRISLVHDCGTSMNLPVDLGQIEGGLVQGLGWMTLEELKYDSEGKLLSNTLASYKIPGIYSTPRQINVHILDAHEDAAHAIFKSKAVGEPPLMYGIGVYFALYNAILAFNPGAEVKYHTPMTPEKVLMSLYKGI